MRKKISYEYDESTELIIKSLCGKTFVTPKEINRLLTTLLHNAYDPKRSRAII